MHFRFHAYGHPSILCTHPTTIEVTKETRLSPKGDCIVAVNSSIGARDLPQELKLALSKPGRRARLFLRAGPYKCQIEGEGDPRLTFSHPTDLVIRKSGFVSDRTLMIRADKSANDLPREIVQFLQDPKNMLTIEISMSVLGQCSRQRQSATS